MFNYNKVLIIGATSGIGKALATRLVKNNIPLVISGRREENLREFASQYGSDRVKTKVFDVTKLDEVRYISISDYNQDIYLTVFLGSPICLRSPQREP